MSSNPSVERVERAYAQQRGVDYHAAKESVRRGISALMKHHDIGFREGIRLFAEKHDLDVSTEADRRRRGALPPQELLDAGLIKVGDKLRGFTQKTGAIPARVGPHGTIVVDGVPYADPVEAVTAVGGIAYGVAAWQKWQHAPSGKTLFELGVMLNETERQNATQ